MTDRLPADRTAVMGVLNVTPDSFFDGGRYDATADAVDHAKRMVDDGADVIDVGGESTRPGADDVDVDTELARVVGVVEGIASLGVPVSVDTRKSAVAKAALDAGAAIVNDVSAGTFDLEMLALCADRGCDVVLMHMRGSPRTMDAQADYEDVVSDVRRELDERLAAARAAGVDSERIMLDPGLGFAKTHQRSLELVARIDELCAMGYPIVVGPSRKRFIGEVLDLEAEDRLEGTLAVVAWCAARGVRAVRVHDVREARRVVEMTAALGRAADGR